MSSWHKTSSINSQVSWKPVNASDFIWNTLHRFMFLRPQFQAHTTVLRGCGAFRKWSLAGGSTSQVWTIAVQPSPNSVCLSLFPALHTWTSLCSCCDEANCSALPLPPMIDCDPLKPWAKINLSVLKSHFHEVFCQSNKQSSQATFLYISL